MRRVLCVALVLLLSASALVACTEDSTASTGTDVSTEAVTTASLKTFTDTQTEEMTESSAETSSEEPTAAPTETSTEPKETEAPDPCETPIRVGIGYDGKTPCYDGRLRHMYESFVTSQGGSFESVQDAFNSLSGIGGAVGATSNGDLGLCLSVHVPDDGKTYILYYNYNNCDFVFNFGCTFDGGDGGYAYYSSLNVLDDMAEALDGCRVYVWSEEEGLEPGYYRMTWIGNGQGTVGRNYRYDRVGDLSEEWKGLKDGETYFS